MTKDKRELLELAARACGKKIKYDHAGRPLDVTYADTTKQFCMLPIWGPTTDDGDCARLEASVGIDLV